MYVYIVAPETRNMFDFHLRWKKTVTEAIIWRSETVKLTRSNVLNTKKSIKYLHNISENNFMTIKNLNLKFTNVLLNSNQT
jgi:hypothetical protein